jgi:hypothetical protein
MHSTIPQSFLPSIAPSVARVPSPALSPAIVGRNLYEQPVSFQSPTASTDFEIERITSPRGQGRPPLRRAVSDYANEALLQTSIANVIAAKARPFAISGRIPVDPATLTLFFRAKVIWLSMGSDPPTADKRLPEWNHALPRFPDRRRL